MSIDNLWPDPATEELWRAHPEESDFGYAFAFGLYFLKEFPADESFDGTVSVGVSRPLPPEGPKDHVPRVVLSYTGDSGVRLTNVLLDPDEARRLAKLLKKAARKAEVR